MKSLILASLLSLATTATAQEGFWGGQDDYQRNATHVNITVDAQPTTCDTITLDWSSPLIPKNRALSYTLEGRVARGRLRPGDEDHAVNSPWLTYSTPEVYIVTPATHVTWKVDFPAGTEIDFTLTTLSHWGPWWGRIEDVIIVGKSANLTVGKGLTNDCVPDSHVPIIVDLPKALDVCEEVEFSWTGGLAPYSLQVWTPPQDAKIFGWDNFANLTNAVQWKVNYPVGSNLQFTITDADGRQSIPFAYNVTGSPDSFTDCIPKHHFPEKRSRWIHPAAIAAYVILGLALLAGVGFAGYRFYLKRREGQVQLP